MKKILNAIILLLGAALLFSCTPTTEPTGEYKLRGVVEQVASNYSYVEIHITEAQNATGTYRVLINEGTAIYSKDGKSMNKAGLKVGDKIEVTYNGQVMRSLPPQIVAIKITVS